MNGKTGQKMNEKKVVISVIVAALLVGFLVIGYDKVTKERTNKLTDGQPDASNGNLGDYTLSPRQREFNVVPYYTGPLIDSHVHMPVASRIVSTIAVKFGFEDMPHEGDIPTQTIECLFKNEGTTKAFGFYLMPNAALSLSVRSANQDHKRNAETIVPFFMPPPIPSLHPDADDIEEAIVSSPGLFKGIGELAIYHYPSNVDVDDPYLLDIYRIANDQHLIVMMHPRPGQHSKIEEIVNSYPDVIFLFHGEESVLPLIEKYPNAYFSVDTFLDIYGYMDEHQFKKLTKEEWLDHTRKNFDKNLNEAVTKWKPIIEKNPDHFLWSTDRWYGWHFDPEVGGLIEELSRSFIGQLDPSVQEQFAYRNAEELLKK